MGTLHLQEGDYLDLDERDVLVLRVRGDGRKYLVSLRTDNWVVGGVNNHDVWQAFLFAQCAPSAHDLTAHLALFARIMCCFGLKFLIAYTEQVLGG